MVNYDKFPSKKIDGECFCGYKDILNKIQSLVRVKKFVIAIDCYPGVDDNEVLSEIKRVNHSLLINTKELLKPSKQIANQLKYILTDDRVFGRMYFGQLLDFIDKGKLQVAIDKIKICQGVAIIYGFGASLLTSPDLLIYLDMTRWEIQLRYRKGMANYLCDNADVDILKKFKQGYFLEWRIADKHKRKIFNKIDYFIDTNIHNSPKMVSGIDLRSGLEQMAHEPFRTVPYFDPGIWGGQWMKKVCKLDKSKKNYAWSFDGVPEENSLLFELDKILFEIPSIDLIFYKPKEILGNMTFSRFGAEFPIRFDLLDTMHGQNLSLQVHPTTDYIKNEFGMTYTQDESYYILDADKDAAVYLGLKDNVNKKNMIDDLQKAEKGIKPFDTNKYINKFTVKKHDHILIPAGTIHCSGANTMVLEISATPYIFTFKLWDWGRLGLDNKPRPINIEHGSNVIQWDRTTEWVKNNLFNAIYVTKTTEDYCEEHTGLYESEPIETRRYWSKTVIHLDTEGTVNMLNLVEGKCAMITSPINAFTPFAIHYAETCIIPASVGKYEISTNGSENIGIILAYIRGTKSRS